MAKVHAYLNFNGECEEAFRFYEKVFDTPNLGTMRYGEMPREANEPGPPEEAKNKVLHTAININEDTMLMGSDIVEEFGMPPVSDGNRTYIMLDVASVEEAEKLYASLAEGAKKMEMKLEETFFAELYASFQDRFGVCWMIYFEGSKKMG